MARFSSGARAALLIAVFGAMALAPHAALAQPSITTQATLLDRIQIEDLLVAYYQPLGSAAEDMSQFYAEDGVLDLNGRVYQGRKGVDQAYRDARAAQGLDFKGKFHMLMSNPRIVVSGDTATADVIWTGISSDTVKSAPHLVEQGREHDELVRQGGRWMLKKRVITSDGGIPDFYFQTYKER